MIPVKSNVTVLDNMPGEEIQFTIGDPRWVMRSLSDLYSNRELACIREYSTNARDAMVMAGKGDEPIKVTLPTVTNPYFTVTDTGVGMSEQVLKERYTKFGDSDKRGTNDANGMLGFGCKSAVAYTNTFTVTSVYNGRKTVAVITRSEDYNITMKIIMSVDTPEGNGTKVEIPVHNSVAFAHIAKDFYRFWKPGQVLVDGVEPRWTVGDKIGDNLFMYPQDGVSYVVMGNVPYRIANPNALFPPGMNKISFVAYVDNGAVEFTPNREDLKYSDHTKKNLHKIIDDFVATALEKAKKEIGAAKTHWEAYDAWKRWSAIVGAQNVDGLEFKGDKVVDHVKIKKGRIYNADYYRGNTWAVEDHGYPLGSMNSNTVVITNFTPNLAAAHKKKARDWASLKGISASKFLFLEDSFSNVWVNPQRIVDWEQVKKDVPTVRKPRQAGSGANVNWGRKAGTFDLITKHGKKREQDIPDVTNLYYIMVQEHKDYPNVGEVLRMTDDDATIVLVPANRKDKFLRNYDAKPALPYLRAKVNKDGPSLIKDEHRKFLKLTNDQINFIQTITPLREEIKDEKVREEIDMLGLDRQQCLKEFNKHYSMANYLGVHDFKYDEAARGGYYWNNNIRLHSLNEYPLIAGNYHLIRKHPKQTVIYMNAVYAARKAGMNV